ncbi:MAG: hypothetical protein QW727_00850 [Candidatus Pacearchaeota archaeon]
MKLKTKKSQEEIVGFVLIVVLIAIIGVIFLGISLRKDSGKVNESQKIASLITSISHLTTQCQINSNFQDVSDLINGCANRRICDDSKPTCEVLKTTLDEVMKASYVVTDKSFTTHYNLTINNKFDNTILIEPVISGKVERCLGRKLVNEKNFGRDLSMRIEVCFNE